ncbi:anti-sigma factor [Lentibacillus halophilus]|uniref:Anti-sigma-W factor RsiW n=1 Tax=Lentibacillus halophilus TaxID=295065 RepID=A0ABN0ZHZ2_9BACI
MERKCEHLLSYMANTLSEADKNKFEAHMKNCDACRKEYEELSKPWEALQFDFKDQHVPESLKEDVFNFIFEDQEKEQKHTIKDRLKARGIQLKKQFTPLTSGLVILLFAVAAILTYVNIQSGSQQQIASSQPAKIMTSLHLTSANSQMHDADGYAYVVQQNNTKKLIVQVNGLPKLEGTETYQVWLLKDGKRLNAGIFNTNESGSGVLTHTLSQEEDFDKIGITKEPKLDNTQPEGKKVVGS